MLVADLAVEYAARPDVAMTKHLSASSSDLQVAADTLPPTKERLLFEACKERARVAYTHSGYASQILRANRSQRMALAKPVPA